MNAKIIKELKLKARRCAQEMKLNKAEEKRAYRELKKMYQEYAPEERKKLGQKNYQKLGQGKNYEI